MKRLLLAGTLILTLIIACIAGVSLVKNSADSINETLNFAKYKASLEKYDEAYKQMQKAENEYYQMKKIMYLYVPNNLIDDAEINIKYTKSLAEQRDPSFLSQIEICKYSIYQLYKNEILGFKTWF